MYQAIPANDLSIFLFYLVHGCFLECNILKLHTDDFIFQDLKLNNLSGLIPVRALLCSYRCFNSSGHDYYGVAFPWSLNEPSPKEWVCPREITVISFDSCGYVLIKQSWPITHVRYTFPSNKHLLHEWTFKGYNLCKRDKLCPVTSTFNWLSFFLCPKILLMFLKVAGISVWSLTEFALAFEIHIEVKQVAWYKLPYHKHSLQWEYTCTYKCV